MSSLPVKDTSIVVKSNNMIESAHGLTLAEQRIITMAIAWSRDYAQSLNIESWVEIRADNYAELFGVDIDTAYKQMRVAAKDLTERKIKLKGFDIKTGFKATYLANWVSAAIYVESIGVIRVRFDEMVIACISQVERSFTSYKVSNIKKLSSLYAIRLYEILRQFKVPKKRYLTLQEIREYLEVEGASYDRPDNLKARVLEPAVRQINAQTDLTIRYNRVLQGRATVGYEFVILSKDEGKLIVDQPLQLTERLPSAKELAQVLINPAFGGQYAQAGESQFDFERRIRPLLMQGMIKDWTRFVG
jgi:plasmid replication initiation protein